MWTCSQKKIDSEKDTKPLDAGADAFAFGSHSAFEYMAGELKTVFEDLEFYEQIAVAE